MSKEVRRRQIKEENRERQRYKGEKIKTESEGKREKESTWSREEKGEEEFGKHTSLQSLLLQLCYLHSNNGGSASAEHLLINNRTGERRGAEGVGVGVLSLSRPGTKQSPVWTEWHFTPAKSIPLLYTSTTEESALSVSACTYIDIKQRTAFSSSTL